MRKSVLALAATSGVFALTAAGASLLTLNGPGDLAVANSGSVDITQTQCTDPWTITYTQTNPGDPITAVTATDTAVTPATACGSSTTATWAFANGHPVNGTWDNTAHAWTFDYSATAPTAPTAAVGLRYSLISNAAAITGNLTIGGPAATDPAGLTIDISGLTFDATHGSYGSEYWGAGFPWLVIASGGDYWFANPDAFGTSPGSNGYTLTSGGFWENIWSPGNWYRIYNATGDGPQVSYIPFT
ncbi:MAG: hypothetical protein F2911_05325 [Actinobacteria bacterium]|uniref:Unannotated protein n=1 Tax=freshwater metagenome TaxID=449393 RepID=A0A6J7RRR2_9ZZZZ|nr:hypothetical protein [Actinomycetota bacterium]